MPECKVLNNHMCISVNGRYRPCCRFIETWNKDEVFFVKDTSFHDYKNSLFYKNIKDKMKSGWHEGCYKCQEEENRDVDSMRHRFGRLMQGIDQNLEFIEISLSNECNLACKMCGPWASSTWQKITKQNDEVHEFRKPSNFENTVNVKTAFNNLDLNNLATLKLLGGEPFITPQTKDLFEYIDTSAGLSKINFMTNTNMTFFPDKLMKYLNKFKALGISLSIDGFDKINDYVRYKSDWSNVCDVMDKWIQFRDTSSTNVTLKFTTCLNAYNVHQGVDIIELANKHNIEYNQSFIMGPDYLTIQALPSEYVKIINNNLKEKKHSDHITSYLDKYVYNDNLNQKLRKFTLTMDKITGMNLKDYNPLLAEHLL